MLCIYVVYLCKKVLNFLFHKMTKKIAKNWFYNVYFDLTLIAPLVKVKNAPKFGEMLFNYLSIHSKSSIKLSQKTPEISNLLQTT